MKILKLGKIEPLPEFEVTCPACKTELLVTEDDGRINSEDPWFTFLHVDCPVCKRELKVDLNRF